MDALHPTERVDRAWASLIRPVLRRHAEEVHALTGRRPAPGEMVALVGAVADLAPLICAPLDPALGRTVCIAIERRLLARVVLGPAGAQLAAALAAEPPEALAVVWVTDGFDVVVMRHVTDTGPEGAAINAPGSRGMS